MYAELNASQSLVLPEKLHPDGGLKPHEENVAVLQLTGQRVCSLHQ